jgi:predicted Zn-dependent protease
MLNKIISILKNSKGISAWKLNERQVESVELFFVKKSLDMDRAKSVHHITLTVYVDFDENGVKYRGSSSSEIHLSFTDEEIKKTIERLTFSASLVKNKFYPLAAPTAEVLSPLTSNLSNKPLKEWIPEITSSVYEADVYDNGGINSAELFLNKIDIHIINSEGVDVAFTKYNGDLEFITTWKETSEEIELYRNLSFSNFSKDRFKEEVSEMINQCRNKAIAKSTPNVSNIPVLLTGLPVTEFFSYYYNQSNASSVYNKITTLKVGDNVQGNNIIGDKLSITLDPTLNNSTASSPYDEDGFSLSTSELFKDGVLQRNWGSVRFSHYLNTKPTGNISNVVVSGGNKAISELKQNPYLELLVFSDFQIDTLTGDFGGEIRLGYYYDGNTIIPITGGSLSGNIKKIHHNMLLSKELQQDNNFVGPKTVLLTDVSIAGCNE